MSVQKIKSDLTQFNQLLTTCKVDFESLKIVVSNLSVITKNDIDRMETNIDRCTGGVNSVQSLGNTVYTECSTELDIFFSDYNRETQQLLNYCSNILGSLGRLSSVIDDKKEFLKLSTHPEWLAFTGVVPSKFNWILSEIQSFKNQLENVRLKTNQSNSKLILKGR